MIAGCFDPQWMFPSVRAESCIVERMWHCLCVLTAVWLNTIDSMVWTTGICLRQPRGHFVVLKEAECACATVLGTVLCNKLQLQPKATPRSR